MDVVVWLRSLGLGQYEAAFRENEIDETVLPGLTSEDLKDLGVGIVGHRRKILDAIAALRGPAPSEKLARREDRLLGRDRIDFRNETYIASRTDTSPRESLGATMAAIR